MSDQAFRQASPGVAQEDAWVWKKVRIISPFSTQVPKAILLRIHHPSHATYEERTMLSKLIKVLEVATVVVNAAKMITDAVAAAKSH